MENKEIRFIDSKYNELFKIPNGGSITITLDNGEKINRKCQYLDEYHTSIGGQTFHICEFAERMEQNGNTYAPSEETKRLVDKHLSETGIKKEKSRPENFER